MIGLIVVVVVLIASIVLAIFASKVWHWAHVLVVVGLVFATIGYSNLGYRVLAWKAKHQKSEMNSLKQLEQVERQIERYETGGDEPSLGDLEHQLRMVNRVRGRLWENVRALGRPSNDTLSLNVGVAEDAPPMNISEGAILYAFEQGDPSEGAAYIGEFRVVQAGPRQLQLEPVLQMDNRELDRYFNSAGAGRPWTLHESMPVDTHAMFAELSEEQLRAMLPAASVEEYLRHGGPTQPDDNPRRVMGVDQDGNLVGPESMDTAQKKVYQRQLRDYAFEFQEHAKRQRELRGEGLAMQSNLKQTQDALASAKKLQAARQQEQAKLKNDLAGAKRDQQAIETHADAVESRLQRTRQLLSQTITANLESAQVLAALQAAAIGVDSLDGAPTRSRAAGDRHAL